MHYQAECVRPGLERLTKDHVRPVVGNRCILIATPCSKLKPASVVSVKFAVIDDAHVEFVHGLTSRGGWYVHAKGKWDRLFCAVACAFKLSLTFTFISGIPYTLWFGLRGFLPLVILDEVALDCLIRGGAEVLLVGQS
jgi:hypothetical protein